MKDQKESEYVNEHNSSLPFFAVNIKLEPNIYSFF